MKDENSVTEPKFDPKDLPGGFTAKWNDQQWIVACPKCDRRWSWPNKPLSVGAALKMLDHAASHK